MKHINSNITRETELFLTPLFYKVKEQMFVFQGGKNEKLSGDLNT